MAGLLSDVLPAVYSASNVMKNKLRGLLDDPLGTLQQAVGDANDRARSFNELTKRAADEDIASLKAGQGLSNGPASNALLELLTSAYNPAGILAPKGSIGKPLKGLPEMVDMGGGRLEPFGTDQRLVDIASKYMADKGMRYTPQAEYAAVDPVRAKRLADAFEQMQHNPSNPTVRASYQALADETQAQYEALLKAGYKFDFIRGADPYGNPRNAINDLIANKKMSVFPTDNGFGGPNALALDVSSNPLLAKSELRIGNDPATTYNDLFRAVHDAFGHAKYGVGFRARGEENAFQSHARMYSPKALPAATSETRGQNSWVNFGPFGESNAVASPANTEYAAQKTGLMQPWTWVDGLLK